MLWQAVTRPRTVLYKGREDLPLWFSRLRFAPSTCLRLAPVLWCLATHRIQQLLDGIIAVDDKNSWQQEWLFRLCHLP